MSQQVTIGAPPIVLNIRRSARARKYSLRISNSDGQVNLTVPLRAPLHDAVAFAKRQEAWLHKHMADQAPKVVPVFGGDFLFEGRIFRLEPTAGRRVRLQRDVLEIPGNEINLAACLRGFCKVQAREKLFAASTKYANILGSKFARITLRDTRSRWGSCSEAGNLMYSWRLILAPPPVLDYVAAHEVAHLRELNHSTAYWALLSDIFPDFQHQRAWLRENGSRLHQVQI